VLSSSGFGDDAGLAQSTSEEDLWIRTRRGEGRGRRREIEEEREEEREEEGGQ